MDHSEEYLAALRSAHWRSLRRRVLASRGSRCEHCGWWAWPSERQRLHLHHLHYDSLGRETPSDVALLCETCHEKADRERLAASSAARMRRRFDGWMRRRYGENECADEGAEWDRFVEYVDKENAL